MAYMLSGSGRGSDSYLRTVAIRAVRLHRRDRWRRSLRRRLSFVDRIPLDRPIFVLGLQSSGTTMIARCLLRHRDVASMSGNSNYWVGTDEIGFVRNRMARLPTSLWSSSHRTDLDDLVFGSKHTSVFACNALLAAYRKTAEEVREEDAVRLKRLIREHLCVYARDPGHARFLDKTHTYSVKVGYLDGLLDGCEPFFLLVLRNPYTACCAAVRRKPPSWRIVPPYDEQLRLVAEHWQNLYRLALEDGAATGRFRAVRFEDFLADPVGVVRAICEFVGLDFDVDLTPQPSHRRPFGMLPSDRKWYPLYEDRWRARVSEADAAIIDAVCQPLASELGYAFGGDTSPEHPLVLAPAPGADEVVLLPVPA
jgi:hypothetical protein